MKTLALSITLAVSLSQAAFAMGHENEGQPAPSQPIVSCHSADESVTVVVSKQADGQDVAVVTTESVGDSDPSFKFYVSQQNPPGIEGGGDHYVAREFTLHIETDLAPRPEGMPGTLNVPAIGVKNQDLICKYE